MVRSLRAASAALLALSVAVLGLGLGLVVLVPSPAYACSCDPAPLAKLAKRADVVFTGRVTAVDERGAGHVYAITARRAYRGDISYHTQVRSPGGTCGLGELDLEADYVFLASGENAPYVTNLCSGTSPANPVRMQRLRKILGEGTVIEKPPPPEPTVTKVEESPPPRFARLAAPGGAAVIVGLLGLLLVRRLARR